MGQIECFEEQAHLFWAQLGSIQPLIQVELLPFVFEYTDQIGLDPTPMVKWLLVSQNFLPGDLRWRSLHGFSSRHQDRTLEIMKCLNFEQEYMFSITLHTYDIPFFANCFPKVISRLHVFIPENERIKTAVILEVIQSLPKLRTISIVLSVGSPSPGQIGFGATCLVINSENKFLVVREKLVRGMAILIKTRLRGI